MQTCSNTHIHHDSVTPYVRTHERTLVIPMQFYANCVRTCVFALMIFQFTRNWTSMCAVVVSLFHRRKGALNLGRYARRVCVCVLYIHVGRNYRCSKRGIVPHPLSMPCSRFGNCAEVLCLHRILNRVNNDFSRKGQCAMKMRAYCCHIYGTHIREYLLE